MSFSCEFQPNAITFTLKSIAKTETHDYNKRKNKIKKSLKIKYCNKTFELKIRSKT